MANPTIIADIEARWRPLSEQEDRNAQAFLEDAWAELLSKRPNLEAELAAGIVSRANAVRVVCAMVLRVLKNPDGYEDESIDDWRGRRSALVASGVLHVTSDELALVTPGRAHRRSIRLVKDGDV